MNNNAWFKKENPLLSLQSMSGGAAGSLMQGAASKTYVDDIFSTFLWAGDGNSGRTITNNIDVSGEGGLVWMKSRTSGNVNVLFDTARGANQRLRSDSNLAQTNADTLQPSFTSSGFTVGSGNEVNGSGNNYASWTWRKQKGFFDIVTWSGTSGQRTLDHNLGCVPGFIMLKQSTGTENWICYHRDFTTNQFIKLNSTHAIGSDANASVNSVSSTQFVVGSDNNGSGYDWVAYVFSGGASTAATARSVDFDGNDDLYIGDSNDFHLTGDFTIEGWFYSDGASGADALWGNGNYDSAGGTEFYFTNNQTLIFAYGPGTWTITGPKLHVGQWHHVAIVRSGTTVTMYVNGTDEGSHTESSDFGSSTNKDFHIASAESSSGIIDHFDGKISNFRVVKGTAVYTSSFRPPTEPLTNISGTVLLCCNNSSTTGSTVTPVTITANGDPAASTDSPFDDPEGFKFGEEEDKSVISCGSYTGDTTNKPEINIGWEPQWMLVKNTNLGTEQWFIFDSMRGIITGGTDYVLEPSRTVQESGWDLLDLTPTGFKIKINDDKVNNNGGNYIYMAIRRPDGAVGKPAEAGTDVFAMDTGNPTNSYQPSYDSPFPVDYGFTKMPASSSHWLSGSRLTGPNGVNLNQNVAESTSSNMVWDDNAGFWDYSSGTTEQAWMWKRGAGFDVVAYIGNGTAGHQIPHSLSQTPEMIWCKLRGGTEDWFIYHKGLNGGSSPENYAIKLNLDNAEFDFDGAWNDTAPNSINFTLGSDGGTNSNNGEYITMLFSSVTGISKVGSYSGTGSQLTVTTGFQPRFIIIKSTSGSRNWLVFDTVRGWAAGNDAELNLNKSDGQNTSYDFGAPTATGFTAEAVNADINSSGHTYVYYAHA